MELFRDENYEPKEPTEFDLFEAMDRTSLIFHHLETALLNHPGLDDNQSMQAQQAFQLLFDIYQQAGKRFFDTQKDDKDSTQG